MPIKGYKQTEEHKKNLKKNHKGFNGLHHTEEYKEYARERALEQFKDGMPEKTRKKIRKSRLCKPRCGNPENWKHSEVTKKLISGQQCGRKNSEESNKKNSESHKGEKSHLWIDGRTPENMRIRNGIEYRLWRESVFARDNWTCQKCNQRGGTLHAHHIQNFAQVKELRTSIENGITFCKECHKDFHIKYGKKDNNQEQINKFINI